MALVFCTLNQDTPVCPPSILTDVGVEYVPLEDVEKLERYRQGGYHPITVGDHLHDRYRIIHKLGFGTYSTTWLAKDQKTDKYVAIKIAIATCESFEGDIIDRLGVADVEHCAHPGQAIIPSILDKFVLSGPNGKHRCFVTVPARMTLAEAQDASQIRLFQLPVARAIVAQLIQGVAFLHSRGVVHAEPIVRLDNQSLPRGVPRYGVLPVWLGKKSELISLPEAKIILTDFGESFLPFTTIRSYSSAPDLLVPPEAHFAPKEPLSFPADVWTLARTIWAIMGQRQLFEGFHPSADWMGKEYVEVLGKLPAKWWQKWDARRKWFNEEGARDHGGIGRPLTERFEYSIQEPRRQSGMAEVGVEEKCALLKMLRAMLAFTPGERPTARDVLQSEWMRKWALPELDKMET
ncbi:kinase-like domain-containing protein [Lipomyces kononenkoae]